MKYKIVFGLLIVCSVIVYGELVVRKSSSTKKNQIEVINNYVHAGMNTVNLQKKLTIVVSKTQNFDTNRIDKKRPMYNCCYIAGQ